MTPGPRFPLVLLLLAAVASTALAQSTRTDVRIALRASTRPFWVVERVPVGTPVEFVADAGWAGGIAKDVSLDIDVPGVLVDVTPVKGGGVNCSSTRPIRCAFTPAVDSDLRGKFITATNNRTRIVGWAKPPLEQSHLLNIPTDTSEFSSAVEVR